MSDTPRTDAIAHRGYHLDALAARSIDLCRELERENGALKRLIEDPNAMHAHYLRHLPGWEVWSTERIRNMDRDNARLERENAALKADKELLDSNMIWLTVDGQPVWFNGCDLRKAIRRAMKEAGDDDIMRQHLNEGGTPT